MNSRWDDLLDDLVDRIAARVAERLRTVEPGMVDQGASPLGRRRHCAAVRRRLARGEAGAAVVGRRHLLSADALGEELARTSHRADNRRGVIAEIERELAPAGSVRAELMRELAAIREQPPKTKRKR